MADQTQSGAGAGRGGKTSGVSSKQFTGVSQKNMQKIVNATSNDVTLQMMVLNTIEEYNAAQAAANEQGISTGEHLRAQKKRRKSAGGSGGGEPVAPGAGSTPADSSSRTRPVITITPDATIPLSAKAWKNWSRDNLRDLVLYCDVDNSLDWESLRSITSKPQLLMLLEHGTDILCSGETGADRITELRKKVLYDAVRAQYVSKGKRWHILKNVSFDGFVDWQRRLIVTSLFNVSRSVFALPSIGIFRAMPSSEQPELVF